MRYKEPAPIIRIGVRFDIYSNTMEVIILEPPAPITAIIIITGRRSEAGGGFYEKRNYGFGFDAAFDNGNRG